MSVETPSSESSASSPHREQRLPRVQERETKRALFAPHRSRGTSAQRYLSHNHGAMARKRICRSNTDLAPNCPEDQERGNSTNPVRQFATRLKQDHLTTCSTTSNSCDFSGNQAQTKVFKQKIATQTRNGKLVAAWSNTRAGDAFRRKKRCRPFQRPPQTHDLSAYKPLTVNQIACNGQTGKISGTSTGPELGAAVISNPNRNGRRRHCLFDIGNLVIAVMENRCRKNGVSTRAQSLDQMFGRSSPT